MGEIADMMVDGTMCQTCGVWLHGGKDGPGYPGFCRDCQQENARAAKAVVTPLRVKCPTCGKNVKQVGLKDHQRDAHERTSGSPK